MKRILFLLTKASEVNKRVGFVLRMRLKGVRVSFAPAGTDIAQTDNTLFVTDDVNEYERIKRHGTDALIYVRNEDELNLYGDARYFVMDVYETEYEYFEKVYKRIHDIPWEIAVTKRLIIRETTVADVDEFVHIYEDPMMTKYMEPLYEDVEEERKYAREYIEKVYKVQGFGIWTVVRKCDGRVLGRAGLTAREGFDELEIGFAIGSEYQRQGYGREAVRAVLEFARDNDFGKINALVMEGNIASEQLLLKEGFSKVSKAVIQRTVYNVWQSQGLAPKKLSMI